MEARLKLAEALAERSDCQKKIEELKKRIVRVARVQEGEKAAEDPSDLLGEVDRKFKRMLELIQAINRTNARTEFDREITIADAIAERDAVGKQRDLLASVADAASMRQDRYTKSEVKFVPTVRISQLQQQVDELSKCFRELDTRIQEFNWQTDLI